MTATWHAQSSSYWLCFDQYHIGIETDKVTTIDVLVGVQGSVRVDCLTSCNAVPSIPSIHHRIVHHPALACGMYRLVQSLHLPSRSL